MLSRVAYTHGAAGPRDGSHKEEESPEESEEEDSGEAVLQGEQGNQLS